jgi:MoxR-like ATPase
MLDRAASSEGSEGWTRRELLRAGGLGLLGLSLFDPFGNNEAGKPENGPTMPDRFGDLHRKIHAEMARAVVGQTQVVDEVVMALFCNAHVLLSGPPGAPRGLTLSTLSRILGLSFHRVQHTNDLLPGDMTGPEVSRKGPIFANMVLADCFDEAPPGTQRVLFDAMYERQVRFGSQTVPLERPFLVLVTQNTDQWQGKWPLSDAQRTRFMMNACFRTPSDEEEAIAIRVSKGGIRYDVERILDSAAIQRIQELVQRIPVAHSVVDYAIRLVKRTRPGHPDSPAFVRDHVAWGSGPRGVQELLRGARAFAVLHGQPHATVEGVRAVAPAVLRQRIALNETARGDGLDADWIIGRLLET